MTTFVKKVGGPAGLLVTTLSVGYVVGRTTETGGRRAEERDQETQGPCGLKDKVFTAGAEYRVLECSDDAILIELIGNDNTRTSCPTRFWP